MSLSDIRIDENFEKNIKSTNFGSKIHENIFHLNSKLKEIDLTISEKENNERTEFINKYKMEMLKAQKEYKEIKEKLNESEIIKKLESEKSKIISKKEALVNSTIELSLQNKNNKDLLKKITTKNSELEQEIHFIKEKIRQEEVKAKQLESEIKGNVEKYESVGGDLNNILTVDLFEALENSIKCDYTKYNRLLGIINSKANLKPNNNPKTEQTNKAINAANNNVKTTTANSLFINLKNKIESNKFELEELFGTINEQSNNNNKIVQLFFDNKEVKKYLYNILKLYFD